MAKTYENYLSTDLDYAKALDMFRFFHPYSLDATSKILLIKNVGSWLNLS